MRALVPLLLLLPLAAPADAAGPELLQNGRLSEWAVGESGLCPAGWKCSVPGLLGAVAPTPKALSAPYAAVMAELGSMQQDQPAQPGRTYRLSVWYQHPQAGHCMAIVRMVFYDAQGEFLDRPTDHIMENVPAWTERVLTAAAPAGTSTVRAYVAGGCFTDPPGIFVVDNLSLRAS